jgi:hypothetical protein
MISLKYAERERYLKVVKLDEHMCEYSNTQLATFDIEEGTLLKIDKDYQSEVLVKTDEREALLGFDTAREIITDKGRLTDLKPLDKATVKTFEGGYEDYQRFSILGIEKEKEIEVLAYKPCYGRYGEREEWWLIRDIIPGVQYVKVNDERIIGLSAIEYVLVETNNGSKQISLMEIGEEGVIKEVFAPEGKEDVYDRKWIKKGSKVKILYKEEPDDIPLLTEINKKEKHVIGAGLTDKIFVEYV